MTTPTTPTTPTTATIAQIEIIPTPAPRILAFDIGIKNLAFCILEKNTVIALQNCNIIGRTTPQKIVCTLCKSAASYTSGDLPYCRRHLPSSRPILADSATQAPYSKLPPVAILRDILQQTGKTSPRKREECIKALSAIYALPLEQPKQQKASALSLDDIHDALRTFVAERWAMFSQCTVILLENQPAFKNPHMKSVQILLYATLREAFYRTQKLPSFHLVHAKKKVEVAPKGDAGYAERKAKSEDRLVQLFTTGALTGDEHFTEWKKAKKRSDMADALCMCVDYSTR